MGCRLGRGREVVHNKLAEHNLRDIIIQYVLEIEIEIRRIYLIHVSI